MSWLWKQSVSVLQLGPWWVSGRGGWARGAITRPSGMHEFPDQHGGHDDCDDGDDICKSSILRCECPMGYNQHFDGAAPLRQLAVLPSTLQVARNSL